MSPYLIVILMVHLRTGNPLFLSFGTLLSRKFMASNPLCAPNLLIFTSNRFSDDWLSSVYSDRFTYRDHAVRVVHHIQKSRYEVDEASRGHLQTAITNGQQKIKTWLKAHPLDNVNWN
jgi:hypothetical protein